MFVVTGGGSGIGAALARALAEREQAVLIVGRRELLLAEVADFSPYIDFLCADISTSSGRQRLVQYLAQTPRIRGLIHNAALINPITKLTAMSEVDWQKLMNTNVNPALFLTQALYEKLCGNRVLHIGSGAAHFPVHGWSAYCVSKAALCMLTRCWQLEEANKIAFASVMPGIIDTAMQTQIRKSEQMSEEKNEFFKVLKAQGRLLKPETVALFLCWLLLDVNESDYVAVEWDIYDQIHHHAWLRPPHQVPSLIEGKMHECA